MYSNCCCRCSFEPEIKKKLVTHLIRCIAIKYWNFKSLWQFQMPVQRMSGNLLKAPPISLSLTFLSLPNFFSFFLLLCLSFQENRPSMSNYLFHFFLSFLIYSVISFFLSFFNGISTFVGYLIPTPSFQKNSSETNITQSSEDKGVPTFPKSICQKVNVIARLEFELAWYDFAVQRFNHHTRRTTPPLSVSWLLVSF